MSCIGSSLSLDFAWLRSIHSGLPLIKMIMGTQSSVGVKTVYAALEKSSQILLLPKLTFQVTSV